MEVLAKGYEKYETFSEIFENIAWILQPKSSKLNVQGCILVNE